MSTLTAAQAAELSKNFLGLAQAIGNYRFSNWKKLSREENQELAGKQWSTLNAGEDMLAMSTTLLINDASSTIKQLAAITAEVDKTIEKIKNVQKVIDIATAIIELAAVIIAKQPLAIPGAVNHLVNALK